MYFKFADTAERLITTNFVDIIGTGDFNTKKYWDGPWTKVSCGWSEDGMNMIFHMSFQLEISWLAYHALLKVNRVTKLLVSSPKS